MLGGLLGSKFCNKCKHGVKCIRTRLVPIRNRKQAMIRISRKDVADLLAAGHDREAFRRIDELIVETNHMTCYDMIDKFCELLLSHLPNLHKQSECPKEVTEAMATLIFAAARFADLSELCDLRRLFTQRYGSDMQSFVNTEFVDKIQSKIFSKEKKLQWMQNIADEFSVKWDSKSSSHELSSSPVLKFDQHKETVPSKISDNQPRAVPCGLKEMRSREEFRHTSADSAGQLQTQVPNDAHVISTPKNNRDYDTRMRTRKVAAYESVTVAMNEKEDPIPHDVNSRSNHIRRHDDGELKNGIRRSRKPNVHDEKEFCIDLEVQGVGSLKSLNDKPANLVPPYTKVDKSNANTTRYDRIKGPALPPPYTKVDEPRNGYHVRQRSVEDGLDHVELGRKQEVPSANNGVLTNMNPPYVKPKDKDSLVQVDPLNSDSADYVRSKETGARANGNVEFLERPRPFSVRRNFRSQSTIEADDNAINVEKPSRNAASDGRRNKSNGSTDGYGIDQICNGDNTISKDPKSPIRGEMTDVVDNGGPLLCTSSLERRHESRPASTYDWPENDENNYEKHTNHPSGGGRNHGSKRGTRAYTVKYDEERISSSNGSKPPIEDEMDNAIDYGKLFHPAWRGQRECRSSRHPGAVRHDEYDEEEMAMDKLLTHLSEKGTPKAHSKDKRTRIVPGNRTADPDSMEHQNEVIHAAKRESTNPPPVRALTMQPEPVSVHASKPPPTRAISMQSNLPSPNYGRVHQRMPDYDELVARLIASKQS